MAVVRKEYLRWIVLEQWQTPDGRRVFDFPQTRGTSFQTFRLVCKDILRQMSEVEFRQIRDDAGLWFFHLPPEVQETLTKKYDAPAPPIHGVWQGSVEQVRQSAA